MGRPAHGHLPVRDRDVGMVVLPLGDLREARDEGDCLGERLKLDGTPERAATVDQGEQYDYEKLLLATGGSPRRRGGDDAEVIYYRTLDDFRDLRARAGDGTRVAVIGGGFIGSELAAALVGAGAKVSMI